MLGIELSSSRISLQKVMTKEAIRKDVNRKGKYASDTFANILVPYNDDFEGRFIAKDGICIYTLNGERSTR